MQLERNGRAGEHEHEHERGREHGALHVRRGWRRAHVHAADGAAGVITESTLRTDKGTIEWKLRPCHYCVAPAPGLVHLRKVLMTVMMNRRLLCP